VVCWRTSREPSMDEKVKIKEEKTDDMIEISIDLPPNPKVKCTKFLFHSLHFGLILDPRTIHKLQRKIGTYQRKIDVPATEKRTAKT
jgi:hypothetical protein